MRGERLKLGPVVPIVADGRALHARASCWSRSGRVLVGTATDPVALGEVRAGRARSRWPRPTGRAALRLADGRDGFGVNRCRGRQRPGRRAAPAAATTGVVGRRGAAGPRVDPARQAAYEAIAAVHRDDAYANLVLPGCCATAGLSGRDAAFATELTYGTLR